MKNEHLIPISVVDIAKQLESAKKLSAEREYLLQRLEATQRFVNLVLDKHLKKIKR